MKRSFRNAIVGTAAAIAIACSGEGTQPTPTDTTPPTISLEATVAGTRANIIMNASDAQSSITASTLYLNNTQVRTGTGSALDTTLAPGSYTAKAVATSKGGTTTQEKSFSITPTNIQLTATATPNNVLEGDTITINAQANSNQGPVNITATYNGNTIGTAANNLVAKIEATNNQPPTITATSNETTTNQTINWNYSNLTINATAPTTAQIGETITTNYTTQNGADSAGITTNDGRRFIQTNATTAEIPITNTNTILTPITYNGKINKTGTPLNVTATQATTPVRFTINDVEQDPRNQTIDPHKINRHQIVIRNNATTKEDTLNLPADTTIQLPKTSLTFKINKNNNENEPLVGIYQNNQIIGVMDIQNNWTTNITTPQQYQLLGIKKGPQHRSGLARDRMLAIHTDIRIDNNTTQILPTATYGRFHPIAPDTIDLFIRKTKYLANGIIKWDDMPAQKIPEFQEALQWLIDNSKDQFGRTTQEYRIRTDNPNDTIIIERTQLPQGPETKGPRPGAVIIGYKALGASGGVYYEKLAGTTNVIGGIDAYIVTTVTGSTARLELLDLLLQNYLSREDNLNTGITQFDAIGGAGFALTPTTLYVQAGPMKIARDAYRTLGILIGLPK